ncbi:MAG: hypothetical protein ACXAD7_24110 [Candidatus Kariarchaeaceae archaeon]|jgi:alpha-amylase/alpha-mannosidase (GH57 family)
MDNIQVMMVLHAYQPPYPIQTQDIVSRIIDNCYRPIAENIENFGNVKIVVNMNASLTEILSEEAPEILRLFTQGASDGNIEFLESGAYHPILPLISPKHAEFQIKINKEINSTAFGRGYKPRGVWPPELAVNHKTLTLLSSLGYQYAIVPENSVPTKNKNSIPYIIQDDREFFLIYRNRNLSNAISFNSYNENVEKAVEDFERKAKNSNLPIVIATDMETFGEHNHQYWNFLFEFLSHPKIETINSSFIQKVSSKEQISKVTSSSWSTENSHINDSIPFPLWDNPLNPVHTLQHMHFDLVQHAFEEVLTLDKMSREDLVQYMKSAQSCQFWWADQKHGRWSKDIIRKGMDLQSRTLKLASEDDKYISNNITTRLERILNL